VSKPVLIVVVILVLIVVLFAVGIGAGVRGGDGSVRDDGDNALLDRLRSVAGEAADVDLDELSADCGDLDATPPVLTFSGTCELSVRRSDERIRVVRLLSNQALVVSAPAPEGDIDDIESDVDPGKEIKVAVGPDGAGDERAEDEKDPIEVGCVGIGTCTVAVLSGS
jgi:hypothetical protein